MFLALEKYIDNLLLGLKDIDLQLFINFDEKTNIILYPKLFTYHSPSLCFLDMTFEVKHNLVDIQWSDIMQNLQNLNTKVMNSYPSSQFISSEWKIVNNLLISFCYYKIYIKL